MTWDHVVAAAVVLAVSARKHVSNTQAEAWVGVGGEGGLWVGGGSGLGVWGGLNELDYKK